VTGNRILDALPSEQLEKMRPSFESVEAETRETVYERDVPIEHVYFPVRTVFSLVSEGSDGRAVEVATVGNEGMVGVPVFLMAGYTSSVKAFCQVPGPAIRMPAEDLRRRLHDGGELHTLLQRYTQALITQISQGAACNRLHTVEQRAARWLMMTADRVEAPRFPLTQEFLAQMLAVQRTSVSEVAGKLQQAGAIAYRRGIVEVLDRDCLHGIACECYDLISKEFARLIPGAE
jgi:CRP-like cAMP-binding protein